MVSSIWATGTPASMLIKSFPWSASRIPSSCRTVARLYGLHARRMTSASRAPRTFSFCNIVKESVRYESSDLTRLADCGRVMQAMNLEGVREGRSSKGVEAPLGERASVPTEESEERMPDRMAMPSVPGAGLAAMPVKEAD